MALSLVCKDCNLPLRSVAEAQEHGEVTGERIKLLHEVSLASLLSCPFLQQSHPFKPALATHQYICLILQKLSPTVLSQGIAILRSPRKR